MKYLVILNNIFEIIKIYHCNNEFILDDPPSQINITDFPIAHNDDNENQTLTYLTFIINKQIDKSYKGVISIHNNIITVQTNVVGELNQAIDKASIERTNKEICNTYSRVNKLLNTSTNDCDTSTDKLSITPLIKNSTKLIDNFNKLVNKIIYNSVIVKLISPKDVEAIYGKIKLQVGTLQINISLPDIVTKIISFNDPISEPTFDSLSSSIDYLKKNNKIVQNTRNLEKPTDVRVFTYLLNILRNYLTDNEKTTEIETVNFIINAANYLHNTISLKLNNFEKLYTVDKIENKEYDINELIKLVTLPVNSKTIDIEYLKESNSRLITYIKINNTDSTELIDSKKYANTNAYRYNERFNILIDKNTYSSMLIQYNSHNIKYYDDNPSDGKTLKLSYFTKDIMAYNTPRYYNMADSVIDKYDYTYKYGHFSKIFTPNKSNTQISDEMNEVINMLDVVEPKPVFIIGYGSSGAGKTSSLIYFNKGEGDQKDGVLIWLLKKLCKDGRYNTVQFYINEFSHRTNSPIRTPPEQKTINYTYAGGKFSITNYNDVEKYIDGEEKRNKYRTTERTINEDMAVLKDGDQTDIPNLTYTVDTSTEIGDILIRLIDTNRYVKATTNNPNSSRSHVVVYVKLTSTSTSTSNYTQEPGYIYIGDFAGVENNFECENPNNVLRFLDIPRDAEKNTLGKLMKTPTRYYNTEPIELKDDSTYMFGGGDKYQDATLGLNEEYLKLKIAEIDKAAPTTTIINYNTDSKATLSASDMYKILFKNYDAYTIITKIYSGNIPSIKLPPRPNFDNFNMDVYSKSRKELNNLTKQQGLTNISDTNSYENYLTTIIRKLLNVYDKNNLLKNPITITIKFTKPLNDLIHTEQFKHYNGKLVESIIKNFLNKYGISNNQGIYNTQEVFTLDKDFNMNNIVDGLKASLSKNTLISTNEFNATYMSYERIVSYANEVFKLHIPDNKNNLFTRFKMSDITVKDSKTSIIRKGNKHSIEYTMDYNANAPSIFVSNVIITIPENTDLDEDPINLRQYSLATFKERQKRIEDIKKEQSNQLALLNKIIDTYNTIRTNLFSGYTFNPVVVDTETGPYILDNVIAFIKFVYSSNVFELSPNFKKLTDAVKKKYELGQTACENRTTEGGYINKSLSDIRKTIDDMMVVKNEGIFIAPAFISECYDSYCPSKIDCFKPNKSAEPTGIQSNIFESIYKDMYGDNTQIKEFYTNLLVCVFCVVNIARSANNPPTARYIDINELKYFVATRGKMWIGLQAGGEPNGGRNSNVGPNNKGYQLPVNTPSAQRYTKKGIAQPAVRPPNTQQNTKKGIVQPVVKTPNTQQVNTAIKSPINKANTQKSTKNSVKDPTKDVVFQNFRNVIGRIAKNIGYLNTDSVTETDIPKYDVAGLLVFNVSGTGPKYVISDIIEYFGQKTQDISKVNIIDHIIEYINKSEIIERIDNFNASSTIGTLDFADRFAKMNMVTNTCTEYTGNTQDKINDMGEYKGLDQSEYHQYFQK